MNVYDIIADSATSWPHRAAIIDEYGSVDYQGLRGRVEQVRARLIELGVQPGEAVGVMGKNSRAFIVGAFAALGCGAAVMPMSPKLKGRELDFFLEATGLQAMLCDVESGCPLDSDPVEVAIDNVARMEFLRTGISNDVSLRQLVPDAAFARFTSGTTSESKGVVLSHKTVLERVEAANKGLKLSCNDSVLWVLPMAFHFFVSIVLYLRYGVTIIICPDHFAETVVELANRHRATFLYAAPLHYRLLAANESVERFSTLRCAVSTSISLPLQTAEVFRQRYGIPITQAYGIIEVGLPLVNLDKPVEKPESVGKALPDYEVAVLDDNLCAVTDNSMGQLAIKGPGMLDAYLSPPQRRSEVLHEGWFLTGDLARQDDEGFVSIVGRTKAMINVGGNKVFPEEVEAVINEHPSVAASKVSARPHPQLGEAVHADIVCRDHAQDIDAEQIIAFCRRHLTSFKVPSSVAEVDSLRQTASGKICRH